jgi:hypothetical protein
VTVTEERARQVLVRRGFFLERATPSDPAAGYVLVC